LVVAALQQGAPGQMAFLKSLCLGSAGCRTGWACEQAQNAGLYWM